MMISLLFLFQKKNIQKTNSLPSSLSLRSENSNAWPTMPIYKTYMQMLVVLGIVIVRCWFVFSKTEITTTAATAATVAARYYRANDEACLQINRRLESKRAEPISKIFRFGIYLCL